MHLPGGLTKNEKKGASHTRLTEP
ncbi:MAG: hypothetical protein H6Q57_2203, partial [Geobacteraceae bacterium]|nr:hypothetical protein [Geobacteraceae bacterium]